MKKGKITIDELIELVPKLCDDIYGELAGKFQKDEQFYELDFKGELKIPDDFADEGIVLPTARDMVDAFVDHIDISNAKIFVNRKGTHTMPSEEAEMMRKYYLGVNYAINLYSDIAPGRVAAKHYALHGLSVVKTIWDADKWATKPMRDVGESDEAYKVRIEEWQGQTESVFPIVVQAVNPRCVFPDPSYVGRRFVIERHKKMCIDVLGRYPHWSNPRGKNPADDVEFISYWDGTYRCDLFDNEPILKTRSGMVEHGYGFLPYIFMESGLGNLSFEAKPEHRYVGLLRYMFDLLIAESRDFSIADVILAKTAWGGGFLEGDNTNLVTEVNQKFGKWQKLPPGVKAVPITPQTPPDALSLHLARTSSAIGEHAAPRSTRGLSETGVRSGADRRLIMAEGVRRFKYSEDAFRHGWAKVLINCAKLYKNVIPGNMKLWARGSTPADEFEEIIDKEKMKEPFSCYVEFAPISEEDEYRRHDDLERLLASGIVTKKWARTQMSNVDPVAMEREEEKERIKQSPALLQIKDQYIGTKMQEALMSMGMQPPMAGGMAGMSPAQGDAGRRMVPPITNRAPLGSMGNLENQWKQQRSQTPMSPTQGQFGGGNR